MIWLKYITVDKNNFFYFKIFFENILSNILYVYIN